MDFTVWLNVTAPYANGLGRRTVFRAKARVEAVDTEHALRSQNFESVGDVIIHDTNRAICILGGGWEVHINCPEPNTKFCKACGAPQGHSSNFCRDCCPRPSHADNVAADELRPRSRRLISRPKNGKLRTINVRDKVRQKRAGKKNKKLVSTSSVDMESMKRQLKGLFD